MSGSTLLFFIVMHQSFQYRQMKGFRQLDKVGYRSTRFRVSQFREEGKYFYRTIELTSEGRMRLPWWIGGYSIEFGGPDSAILTREFRKGRDRLYVYVLKQHFYNWWHNILFRRIMSHFDKFRSWRKFRKYQLYRKCCGGGQLNRSKNLRPVFAKRLTPRFLNSLCFPNRIRFHNVMPALHLYRKAVKVWWRQREIFMKHGKNVFGQYKHYRRNKYFPLRNFIRWSEARVFKSFIRRGTFLRAIHAYLVALGGVEGALEDEEYSVSVNDTAGGAWLFSHLSAFNEVASSSLRHMYYSLKMRKKESNYYMTVIDRLGGVVLHYSSGQFLLTTGDRKRNKKTRISFRYLIDFLKKFANLLRKHKIFRLKYFFRPFKLRKRHLSLVVYVLLKRGIIIETLSNPHSFPHSLPPKTTKARRL